MVVESNLDADAVRRLANAGRVEKDPRYHAFEHHVRFKDILQALALCHHVRQDTRRAPDGRLLHPVGYVAWCPFIRGRDLRVDFNRFLDEDGEWLLVVTAFEVGP